MSQNIARLYNYLLSPVETEKAYRGMEKGQYVFKVAPQASKTDIKKAVEALFKVVVKKVSTVNRKPKTCTFRGRKGTKARKRLAYVSLATGHAIDFTRLKD